MTYSQPVEEHERELAACPEPSRSTYVIDWPLVAFWGGYLGLLLAWTIWGVWP